MQTKARFVLVSLCSSVETQLGGPRPQRVLRAAAATSDEIPGTTEAHSKSVTSMSFPPGHTQAMCQRPGYRPCYHRAMGRVQRAPS